MTQSLWQKFIEKLKSGEISLQEFINLNADKRIYYSTPAGENAEGKTVLWVQHNSQLNVTFYPAYTSAELCSDAFSKAGRRGFAVIEGTLKSALASLDSSPPLQEFGLMVHDEGGSLAIPPKMRVEEKTDI